MSGGNAQAYFLEVSPLPTTARTNEYFQLEHLNFKPPISNIYSTCKQGTIKRHSSSAKSFTHPSQSFPQTIGIIDQDQGSGRGDLGSGMLGTEVVCFKAERCGADVKISRSGYFRFLRFSEENSLFERVGGVTFADGFPLTSLSKKVFF